MVDYTTQVKNEWNFFNKVSTLIVYKILERQHKDAKMSLQVISLLLDASMSFRVHMHNNER